MVFLCFGEVLGQHLFLLFKPADILLQPLSRLQQARQFALLFRLLIGGSGFAQTTCNHRRLGFCGGEVSLRSVQFGLSAFKLATEPFKVFLVLLQQAVVLLQLAERSFLLVLLLLQALNLLITHPGLLQLALGVFPGALGLGLIIILGQFAKPVDLLLVFMHPLLQLFNFKFRLSAVFFQFQVIAPGLAGTGQQGVPLAANRLDQVVAPGAGHFSDHGIKGGLQMVPGMLDSLLNVLPGALLHPQQSRYAPVFGFAGTALRVLVAQQLGQFFFRVVFAVGVGADFQVTAFALQEALGEMPGAALVLEIQFNGGRRRGIAPGAKVVNGG